jgi:hypothetical protein
MVRCLVKEFGADVNQANRDDGFTPLHAAAQFGQTDLVQCLINELGADFNHADEEGWTAIDKARKKGHQAIVFIIEAAVLEAATQANLGITSGGECDAAAAAPSQIVAAGIAPHALTGAGSGEFYEDLALYAQQELERKYALLLVTQKEAVEAQQALQTSEIQVCDMQEEIRLLKLIMARERQESSDAHKHFQNLWKEEAANGKRQLEVRMTNEKQELKSKVVKVQDKADHAAGAEKDASTSRRREEDDASRGRRGAKTVAGPIGTST